MSVKYTECLGPRGLVTLGAWRNGSASSSRFRAAEPRTCRCKRAGAGRGTFSETGKAMPEHGNCPRTETLVDG